jgi:hypothetical protein
MPAALPHLSATRHLAGDKSGRCRSPTPGAAFASTTPISATRPTSARRAAPTRKANRLVAGPYFVATAGPIAACCPPPSFSVPELVTGSQLCALSPQKNLIFLHDSQNNFKFILDFGASISILPHVSSGPPTDPHLVGANGKLIPAWGRHHQTVCFAGHNFEFDFFLAAVATPIIGMDFLAKFELSIIPAKQQVLHFTKASTSSFVSPWSPETAAAVSALPPQVQKPLEEFPSLLRPNTTPPKPLHGVVHHIDTGSAAPVFACPRRLDPENTALRRIPRLGKSRHYPPLKFALGVPAAPGPQEGWVVAPLRRLPPPERRHHTRQVTPPQYAVSQ